MANKLSVLAKLRPDDLHLEPFPHMAIENCLDEKIYQELEDTYMPTAEMMRLDFHHPAPGQMTPNNERRQISARAVVTGEAKVSNIWKEFIEYHTSKEYFHQLLDICEAATIAAAPDLEQRLGGTLRDATVGVRRVDDERADIVLDCQPGINTPVSEICSVIGPHLDNPLELYAGLLYFRDRFDDSEGGEFVIQKWRSVEPRLFGKHRILPEDVIDCAYVPYRANQFAFFINTINTIHAVTPRQKTDWVRRLVNIIVEVYPSCPEGVFETAPYYADRQAAGTA